MSGNSGHVWLFLNLAVIILGLMGSKETSALRAIGVYMKATPSVCSAPSSGYPEYKILMPSASFISLDEVQRFSFNPRIGI